MNQAKFLLCTVALLTCSSSAESAAPESGEELSAAIEEIKAGASPQELWDTLVEAERVPFVEGDRAVFLYLGEAERVGWAGDFSRWRPEPATRVGESDLWVRDRQLPEDARADYKLVVDGEWTLDPNNPRQSWSGFGPNSELRMPRYEFPEESVRDPDTPRGELHETVVMESDALTQSVRYQVYTPHGYEGLEGLPSLYVTDGHEYADDRLGALIVSLDNLIAAQKIPPVIAVLIDPRGPSTGVNRRMAFYMRNKRFAEFVAEELVPRIDTDYKTDPTPAARTILGTSLGGLNALYFGAELPDTFEGVVAQSPGMLGDLVEEYRDVDVSRLRIALSGGVFFDDRNGNALAEVLTERGKEFLYLHVNEGHSWGAWRGQFDELLPWVLAEPGNGRP